MTAEMDEIIALSFPSIVSLKGWSTGWGKNKIMKKCSGPIVFLKYLSEIKHLVTYVFSNRAALTKATISFRININTLKPN